MTEVLHTLVEVNDLEAGARYLLQYGNRHWLKLPVLADNIQWFILAARVFDLTRQERFQAALGTDNWNLVLNLFEDGINLSPAMVIPYASVTVLRHLIPYLTDEEYAVYNSSIDVFISNKRDPKPVADDPRFSEELAVESLQEGFDEGYLYLVTSMPVVWHDVRVLPTPDFAAKVVEWCLCYGHAPEVVVKSLVVYNTRDDKYKKAVFLMSSDKRFARAMKDYDL